MNNGNVDYMCYIIFMILMTGVRHIGAPRFIILDHHNMLEVTPAVQSIILLLLGRDVTQGKLFDIIVVLIIYILPMVLLMLTSFFV